MTTLTAPDDARAATASAPAAPRLKLRRAGRAERSVELENGKCTIGSSPRCHVCLPAAEAQPLQCLLSLESGAATVTRWAAGVLLNGREFSKQVLQRGDRLSIGPWEIEWDAGEKTGETRAAERQTVDFIPAAAAAPVSEPKRLPTVAEPVRPPFAAKAKAESETTVASPPAVLTSRSTAIEAGPTAPTIREAASLAANPALTPAPVQLRPAAKTVLVSSRLTDPFTDLLGPAKPSTSATIPVSQPPAPARSFTSLAFEDRLVVSLWTASFSARTRAKALVVAAQVARSRVAELVAAVSQVESQLKALRTAGDAQAAESKSKLVSLQSELTQAIAARTQLAAELESLRSAAPKTLPPDPRLKSLADAVVAAERQTTELRADLTSSERLTAELREQIDALHKQGAAAETARAAVEQQLAPSQTKQSDWETERQSWERQRTLADQEAARLREQLYACESQIEPLREQVAQADSARAALADQIAALEKQRSQWLAECQALEQHRAAELAEVVAERDELQRQLDELASAPAALLSPQSPQAAPSWQSPFAESTLDNSSTDSASDDSPATMAPKRDWNFEPTIPDAIANDLAEIPEEEPTWEGAEEAPSWAPPVGPVASAPSSPLAKREPESPAAPQTEATAAPSAPISFIDKYRHLLDDDGEPEPSPRRSQPILDDEYLSPSKFEPAIPADEDSDEALEAYMSNMMRRVRGDGSIGSQAMAAASTPSSEARLAAVLGTPAVEPAPAPLAEDEPEIEVDANGMLRLVRKPQAATDLTALRELANTSARTAIAHHRQRRRLESAVSKGIICVIAFVASAYLLLTAPDVQSPWFWSGCVALVAAAGSGVQLSALAWQRMGDRRRFPQLSAPSQAAANFSPLPAADAAAAR